MNTAIELQQQERIKTLKELVKAKDVTINLLKEIVAIQQQLINTTK